MCLAVTCQLHFWQNDRDHLQATVVTQGWNVHENKSLHRKLTPEKKILLQAPTTFHFNPESSALSLTTELFLLPV